MSTPPDPKALLPNEQKGFPQARAPMRPPLPPPRPSSLASQNPSLPNQDPYRQYWAGPPVHPSAKDIKRSQRSSKLPPNQPGSGNK